MKRYLLLIPEGYLVVSVLYYWVLSGTLLNPFAFGLLVAVALLLFFRSKTVGILFSLLFILVNLFMFAALMSEYRRFHEPTVASRDLLIYGSVYIGLNLLVALVMLFKYGLMEAVSRRRPSGEQSS